MSATMAANPAVGAIALAVSALYGATKSAATSGFTAAGLLNDYFNKHIEEMQGHENSTIARSGRVLEAAKIGFGIGYVTSVAIIATGQVILGNTLAAGGTVMTAAVATNPFAMTCAAMGAVIYGYSALSDVEREELVAKISTGLEIGIELVKSIIRFVVDTAKGLLSKENVAEMKNFIATVAETFGKTLSDVTRKVKDRISDGLDVVRANANDAAEVISLGFEALTDNATEALETVTKNVSSLTTSEKTIVRKRSLPIPSKGKAKPTDVSKVGTLIKRK